MNEQAVKQYYQYLNAFSPVVNNSPIYLIHNLHMQAACANMAGQFEEAMKVSVDSKNSFDSSWQNTPDYPGIFLQYVYMTPYLTLIRFGKWDDILQTPENPPAYIYAHILWRYGRGLAFARKHNIDSAMVQLNVIKENLGHTQLRAAGPAYANPGISGAQIAEKILEGVILEEQNNLNASIASLQLAVTLEDSLAYNEPEDWVHPARQYLGAVLLKAKRYVDAANIYTEDLKINPDNGWSLTGLSIALKEQGRYKKAKKIRDKAAKAFAKSDQSISWSVY